MNEKSGLLPAPDRHRRPPQALHRLVFYTESRFGSHGRLSFRVQAGHLLDHSLHADGLLRGFDWGIAWRLLSNPGFGSTEAVCPPPA